jgi:hypothetical protein
MSLKIGARELKLSLKRSIQQKQIVANGLRRANAFRRPENPLTSNKTPQTRHSQSYRDAVVFPLLVTVPVQRHVVGGVRNS